jgi:hypothetical protein
MENDWLREALFCGQTCAGYWLGTVLSRGWFWVRTRGCLVGYRGYSLEGIEYGDLVLVAESQIEQISPPDYLAHDKGAIWYYLCRWYNCCGYQEKTLSAASRVWIDANGELAPRRANNVFSIMGKQVGGDKVELVVYYHRLEQESAPVRFNIYYDNGTGQIDFENVFATVSYSWRRYYKYQSGSLGAGRYLFCARTEDAAGIESGVLPPIHVTVSDDTVSSAKILEAQGV